MIGGKHELKIASVSQLYEHSSNPISTYLVFSAFRKCTLHMAPREKWYNNDGLRDVWTQMSKGENDMALKFKWVFVHKTQNGF